MAKLAPRHHKLMTKELLKRFAQVGRQESVPFEDKLVIAKYFNPYGRWTYYATEFDPETRCFFGYADGVDFPEWGYTSLDEIEQTGIRVAGYLLPLERDCFFQECKFSEVKK